MVPRQLIQLLKDPGKWLDNSEGSGGVKVCYSGVLMKLISELVWLTYNDETAVPSHFEPNTLQ